MSLCRERGKKHLVQDKLTFHLWAKLDYLVLLIGGGDTAIKCCTHCTQSHCVQVDVGFTILGHFQMEKQIYNSLHIYKATN